MKIKYYRIHTLRTKPFAPHFLENREKSDSSLSILKDESE